MQTEGMKENRLLKRNQGTFPSNSSYILTPILSLSLTQIKKKKKKALDAFLNLQDKIQIPWPEHSKFQHAVLPINIITYNSLSQPN